jgi:endonuclease/exonuclease/phosphatase family metal-dependent hydrolase
MKLISLNIEGDKHLGLVVPFLEKERPDVLCLQEVFESDALNMAQKLKMEYAYTPMTLRKSFSPERDSEPQSHGIAILSRTEFTNVSCETYFASSEDLKPFNGDTPETIHKTIQRKLLTADVMAGESACRIGTTHFTWTPDGLPTDYQEKTANALLSVLASAGDIVLCGDFNIPRGINILYEKFTARYTDAIPGSYETSLDMNLHRHGNDIEKRARMEKFMVDYLFLSKPYHAENVRLVDAVSDHKTIVADISKL